MYITRLVLDKYRPFLGNDTQYFEYKPTHTLQLIVGTNGSGKSKLLSELTPLPSHDSNFLKGGSKILECTHDGLEYVLTSVYNSGTGKHSFKRINNGIEEELNQGGTITIQRELVELVFGINQEIHDLLTGVTTFTGLSTAKRREWLTKMSPVDLSYAFKVFNTVKTLNRDQQGVIKHLNKRLVNETQDLPDESDQSNRRKTIEQLTSRLNRLFEERDNNTTAYVQSEQHLRDLLHSQVTKAKKLLSNPPVLPEELGSINREGLVGLLSDVEQLMAVEQTQIERMVNEYDELLQTLPKKDETLTEEEIQSLRDELQSKQQELNGVKIDATSIPLVVLPRDRQPRVMLKSTFDEWMGLVQQFPNNEDEYFTQGKGIKAKEDLTLLKSKKVQLEGEQNKLASRLSRLKGCEQVICPSCEHTFAPGVDPKDIPIIEEQLKVLGIELETLEQTIKSTEEYLESFTDYMGYVRAFKRLTEHSDSAFTPVWDYCLEQRVMTRKPQNHIPSIIQWYSAMEATIAREELLEHIELIQHKLRYVEALDHTAIHQTEIRKKKLETDIELHTTKVQELSQRRDKLNSILKSMDVYTQQLDTTINELTQIQNGLFTHIQHEYQNTVKEVTRNTQIQLAQEQEVLSRINTRAAVLEDIQNQQKEAQERQKDYDLLVKALAPTNGLIGRYLMKFMQDVVKLLNSVISEVWSYPLEVLPSKVDKDELDYKFPLSINDGAVTPPDVALGSASQVDIINFAFKLLVLKYLKLTDFPLYLDELGATFDEQHRHNLVPFIIQLLESGQVNQVFFISHYTSLHGAFNQAQVCVLDPTNITVPQKYNEHVTIR